MWRHYWHRESDSEKGSCQFCHIQTKSSCEYGMVMVGNLVVSKIFAMPKRVAEIRSYQHLLCRQSTKSDTLWGNWCRILASQVWVRLWYEQNFNRLAPRSSTYLACATFTPKLHCSTSCHASLQPSHTIAFAGQLKKLSGQETGKVHSV